MIVKVTKILSVFCLLLASIASAAPVLIPSPPSVAAKGYLLIDANSGKVLVEKNADERLEPASLTKMMTSYIADYELAQGNIHLDDKVKISTEAWAKNFPGSSLMFLEAGKEVSVSDLLRGVVISSGNDASVALAEHVAGSSEAFADIMNQHAALLGMNNSHFVNPHGLPDELHYTTARDMATLAQAIIRDFPEHYKLYAEKSFTYNNIKQSNRNTLLWRDSSVDGLKTGYTESAGYCLVSSAKKSNMRLIAVVMGAASTEARIRESQKLLSYGFRYYKTLKLYDAEQVLSQAQVYGGKKELVNVMTKGAIYVTVPRSQAKDIEAQMSVDKYIEAPIAKNSVLGELMIMLNDEVQLKQDLVAENAVEEGGLFLRLWHKLKLFALRLFDNV